jgi:hypothetical protein
MSLKHLTVAVLLAACTLVPHASAQQNELSGLLGRTFISDQGIVGGTFFDNNVHFGSGLTFEANYARRLLDTGFISLSAEVPFVYDWNEEMRSDAPTIPQDMKVFFLTPAARVNFFSSSPVSPWLSFGGGFGHFSEGSTAGGVPTPDSGTTTGALQAGVGLDVEIYGKFSARAEARDFWSGVPQLNVDTGKSHQHNYFVGVGVVWHF